MKTKRLTFAALLLLIPTAGHAQQSPTPQPAQTAGVPCGVPQTTTKPTIKVPAGLQKYLDKYSPVSSADLNKSVSSPKPTTPCPPPSPNTVLAPTLHIPSGVVTTWLCNPIITSTDPSHTTTFVMPDALTSAEPAQANTFEADSAKADPKATASCANLRRDPKTNKVFLVQ